MSTKSHTLIPHRLQDHNFQTSQKNYYPWLELTGPWACLIGDMEILILQTTF
jgi:hypothetical protein